METNLLKQLDIVEGDTKYPVYIYDEGAHNKIGALGDLTTEDKSNIVSAVNELVTKDSDLNSKIDGAVSRIDGYISNLDTDLQSFKTQTGNNLTTLSNKIGELNNLDTETKDNLVNAINEVLNDVQTLDPDLMHYTYVEKYLDLGQNATTALRNAIADCPAKGTVVIPRTQSLAITETIVIDKPITIKGLSGGVNQLEGGNNNTPNSEYVKYDIRFTGGEIGFNILSPSVHIEDLVIKFNVDNDFIVFNLNSQTGDNLNMPRDIKLTNISCYNEDMSYSHLTYGVYSSQTCLLSTFNNVLFGWVSRGFYFTQENINTSLRFINCSVTCKLTGFYLNHATYCYFIGCSVESPNTNGAFYFDYCTCITLVGCFTEQIASASIISNVTFGLTIIGMFTTTLPILQATLGTASLIGCKSTIDGTLSSPEVLSNSCNLTLAGNAFQYIKQGNITGHNVYNNHVLNHHEGISEAGYTLSGASIVASSDFFNQIDRKCQLGCDLNVTSTTVVITCPVALAPMYTSIIAGNGYKGVVNQNGTITLTFTTTGVHSIDIEYEAIASF